MRPPRLRTLCGLLLAIVLAACDKPAPVVTPPPRAERKAVAVGGKTPVRERREYSALPDGERAAAPAAAPTDMARIVEAEARRGGPRGEPRVYENPQEQTELMRGAAPKYMNGQFRYYLASVSIAPPQESGCKTPLLAIRLAVENLHGAATSSIRGTFTFARSAGDESTKSDPVAVPLAADVIGPFSERRGGTIYVTAYAERSGAAAEPSQWAEIAAINPSRLKVWFKPETFYYPNGTQYDARSGEDRAGREALPCGGADPPTLARK